MQRELGKESGINGAHAPNGHVVNGVNRVELNGVNGTHPSHIQDLDVLIAGAGFAGCYLLYQLRKKNFKTKIVEAGSDLGGIWHWNSYPGARVDSQYPIYAYSLPEVYEDWTWTEHYPGEKELKRYFAHVDKKLHVKKDVHFNTKVTAAEFDENTNKWAIYCDDGTVYRASVFIAAIGFAAKRAFPEWEGLDTFEGIIHHSSFWPLEGVDVRGKKVGVVGTGATGVQIAQECSKEAGELTVFQRTPNMCCPMRQEKLTVEEQEKDKIAYPDVFKERLTHYAGFMYSSQSFKTFDHTPEEREAFFEELWNMV